MQVLRSCQYSLGVCEASCNAPSSSCFYSRVFHTELREFPGTASGEYSLGDGISQVRVRASPSFDSLVFASPMFTLSFEAHI